MKLLYRNPWSGALLVFLIAALCYLNTLGNEFAFDDLEIIVENPFVTGEGTAQSIFTSHYWQHVEPGGNLYRPVTIASYAVNHALGGLSPAGYHVINLLLHALCSFLVVVLAWRFDFGAAAATVAGLLFATHPVHTEAVTGVVGRAELLAAAGVLGAWAVHLSRENGPAKYVLMSLCFLAGLLSKENAVVLPALVVAGDFYRVKTGRLGWKEALPPLGLCGIIVVAWIILRSVLLPDVEAPLVSVFAGETLVTRVATSLTVLTKYVGLLVFPLRLSADYSFAQITPVDSLLAPAALFSGLAFAGLTLFSGRTLVSSAPFRNESRQAALGFVVFLLALAPVSNIFVSIGTIMGERLLYLPSAGWCLALPPLWHVITSARHPGRTAKWSRAGIAITLVLVSLFSLRTVVRNRDWKDQLTLFSRTVEVSPRSAKAHFNLGVSLEEAGRFDEALAAYNEAIAIRPDHAKAHHNTGILLASNDRLTEAAGHLEAAALYNPQLNDIFSSLGVVYTQLDRAGDAERSFQKALEQEPRHHDALYNLGTLMMMRNAITEAIPLLEDAVETDGSDPDARYQLGLAYRLAGEFEKCIEQMEMALRLLPDLVEAHLQAGLAYVETGNRQEAAAAAGRAREAGLTLPPELANLLE